MKNTGAVLVLLVLLVGCTADQQVASEVNTPTPSSSPTPVEVATDGAINDVTDETISTDVVPTWDETAATAAHDAAVTAMTAFARPELSYDDWWAQLRPHLTLESAETYVYTDPINIPASKVTGEATVMESSSAYLALVDVETDVGVYQVLMVRTDGSAPWLASEFAPPPDLGP